MVLDQHWFHETQSIIECPPSGEPYEGQVVHEVSAKPPTHSGESGSVTHSVVTSPVLEWITRIDFLSSWQDPHTDSVGCEVRAVVAKARESLQQPPNGRWILDKVVESVSPSRTYKHIAFQTLTPHLHTVPSWLVQKTDWWALESDNGMLN